MEIIVLMRFEIDEDQVNDNSEENIKDMNILLQRYLQNVVGTAMLEDGVQSYKLTEVALVKMFSGQNTPKHPFKGLGGQPKMTGGEGK